MEEKDISGIAGAVAKELAKLNVDSKTEEKKSETEVFTCPDCGASVTAGIGFCQSCGCALEWSE